MRPSAFASDMRNLLQQRLMKLDFDSAVACLKIRLPAVFVYYSMISPSKYRLNGVDGYLSAASRSCDQVPSWFSPWTENDSAACRHRRREISLQ